jgi:hypothetical protein
MRACAKKSKPIKLKLAVPQEPVSPPSRCFYAASLSDPQFRPQTVELKTRYRRHSRFRDQPSDKSQE